MAGGDYNLGTAHGTIELNASALGRASGALDHVANRMLLVGGAAAIGIGYAVKAAGDFEQQMSRFQAVANATKSEMDGIRKKALQLGQDSAYGATEVITAFAELGYAGVTTKEILGGVGDAVVYLAAAAEIPLKDAATALVNTMRQFGIPAKDAVSAVNDLARAANASTLDMADLITSMRYAGPLAAALNIPLNDVAQTLALLGNNGIRGSTAGTSLRGILIALTPTSDKAAAMMQKLGLITSDAGQTFVDAQGNILSLEQATALAAATFKHKTAPSAETLAKDFKKLGLSAQTGSNLFFTAEGKLKSMAEVAQILQDHTKNLTDEQKKMAFTIIFQRRAMASAIVLAKGGALAYYALAHSAQYNVTAQELMKKKLDNMKGAVKILKASLETFAITIGSVLTPILKDAARELTHFTNWLIRLSPETKKWIVLVVGSIGGLFLFAGALLKIGKGIVGMYKALRDLAGGIKLVGSILGRTITASPWILALIGIALAIYYLYNNSALFKQFVDDFVQELGQLEVAFAGWIGDTVGSPEAKKFLHDFLTTLGEFEVGFVNWVGNTFGSPYAKKKLHEFLHELGQVEVGFAAFMFNTFGSPEAKNFLQQFLLTLGGAEVGFTNFMLKTFGSSRAKKFLHGFLDELGHVEVGIVLFVAQALDGIGHFGIELAKNVAKWIGDTAKFVVAIYHFGSQVVESIAQGINDTLGTLGDLMTWMLTQFPQWLGNTIVSLVNKGADLVEGLFNGIISGLHWALDGAYRIFLAILGAVADAATWLVDAGEHLVHGMWKGIKSAAGWLIDKIKGWVGDIVGSVESFFGIKSPSTVFAEIGAHLVAGLARGILSNAGTVQRAYEALMPNIDPTIAFALGAQRGRATTGAGSVATARGAGVGYTEPSLKGLEKHLSRIADTSGKGGGDMIVNVHESIPTPTRVGFEAVRQLKAVQFRGSRPKKRWAAV